MPSPRMRILSMGVALAAAGCGTGHAAGGPNSSTPTSTTSSTTATTVPAPTTTTLPTDPQTSPLAAATVFISGWKAGDRAESASVAVPAAVASLFASPYFGQTVIDRQCTDEFLPRVCAFGPYGGGSGALYQVSVLPDGSHWYVSNVQILG